MTQFYVTLESVSSSSVLSPVGDLRWTKTARSIKDFPASKPGYSTRPESSSIGDIDEDLLNRYVEAILLRVADDYQEVISDLSTLFTTQADNYSSSASDFKENLLNRYAEKVSVYVKRLFSMAENIEFEVGMINDFSEALERAIEVIGVPILVEIRRIILNEETSLTVAAETMCYIGNIESPTYRAERRELLETCLSASRFIWVKEGAAVGLSYIDDPQSIPVLKQAIQKERHQELKEDLNQILKQLEETDSEL